MPKPPMPGSERPAFLLPLLAFARAHHLFLLGHHLLHHLAGLVVLLHHLIDLRDRNTRTRREHVHDASR